MMAGVERWELVAGVETHVQLATATKLFCSCAVEFGAPPNARTCPVCLGLPGVLPVPNRQALVLAVRAALMLDCEIAARTKFDRKQYFYPDLPKNYQISQYDMPLARGGAVEFVRDGEIRRVRLVRLHLEEDAGKLVHDEAAGCSKVDLNRAGVPLIEIVTEPDLRSPEDVYEYLCALKTLMQYAEVSDCDMEKGELRCDINLSVRPRGAAALGVKTEIKNLNSFRFAQKAVEYEFARQVAVLEAGGRIVQETRLFDPQKGETRVMRTKEEAQDYRYFPDPDLLPLEISPEFVAEVRRGLPEKPLARRRRFVEQYGITDYDAEVLTAHRRLADFFEAAARACGNPKAAANWITNELARVANAMGRAPWETQATPEGIAALVRLVDSGRITGAAAKQVVEELARAGGQPEEIVRARGLETVSDESALEAAAREVIGSNPKPVADYRAGKKTAVQFLVGQVMKKMRGRADANRVREMLVRMLGE